jgi:hypothetical protein
MGRLVFIVFFLFCFANAQEPVIYSLAVSDCNRGCLFKDTIESQSYSESGLKLGFSVVLNCCFKSDYWITFEIKGDSLFINCEEFIQNNSDPIVDAELISIDAIYNLAGDEILDVVTMYDEVEAEYVVEYCYCDCVYQVNLEFVNMIAEPKSIYVNSKELH